MSSHANLFFSFYKESTTYLYLNRDQIIIFIIPSFWCIVYEFCYLNTTPRRIVLTEQRMCATIFYMLFTCTATVIRSKKNTENIWTIDSQQSYIMVPYYYLLKLGRLTAYFFRFFILSRYTDMNIKLYCVHLNFISDFIQPNQHKTVTTIHSIVFDALWEPKSNTNSIFCIFIICSNQILFYFFWFTSIPWQKLTAFSTIKMTKSSFFPFFSF